MIELKDYTTDELKTALNITRNAWERRKEDVLSWMEYFFDYEIIYEGNKIYYRIKQQYSEWQEVPRKYKSLDVHEYYQKEVANYVEFFPVTTGSAIGRYIVKNKNQYDHSEYTATKQCRTVLREDYTKSEGAWCIYQDEARTLPVVLKDEVKADWDNILKTIFNSSDADNQARIVSGMEEGMIDEIEGGAMLTNIAKSKFRLALKEFSIKYGSYPFYAPRYEIKTFE